MKKLLPLLMFSSILSASEIPESMTDGKEITMYYFHTSLREKLKDIYDLMEEFQEQEFTLEDYKAWHGKCPLCLHSFVGYKDRLSDEMSHHILESLVNGGFRYLFANRYGCQECIDKMAEDLSRSYRVRKAHISVPESKNKTHYVW